MNLLMRLLLHLLRRLAPVAAVAIGLGIGIAADARAAEATAGGTREASREASREAMPDADWMSYRDAYRVMIRFEKYGKPKQLIQSHFRVVPKEESASLDGVRLTLASPSGSLNLLLDGAGRAAFPFLKSAFDDNARLQLNRSGNRYAMHQAVSIVPRADGIYEAADLQAACEQALAFLRDIGRPGMQDRKCAGVRFAYPRQSEDPAVSLRGADHGNPVLAVEEAPAFAGDAGPVFRTVTYRFMPRADKGSTQVHTRQRPIAITPVFD
jgi:hypothetical protein